MTMLQNSMRSKNWLLGYALMGENIYAKTKLIGNYRTIANLLIISKHDIDKKAAVVEPIMSKAANSY